MQGVILKESELLDIALNNKKVKKADIPNILVVLSKHYFSLGLSKEEVYDKLNEYYKSTDIGYNETVSYEFITSLINRIYNSGRFNIVDVDKIVISVDEWNRIISLNDKGAEKLAFSMLVHQKANEIKNPKSNGWINTERSYLLMDAGFTKQTLEVKLHFHTLYKNGYIGKRNAVDATGYLINYRDVNVESDPKITITNFEKIITYYDEHRNGNKYKECEVCGKRFKLKSINSRAKYCSSCGKKVNIEKTKEKYKKI